MAHIRTQIRAALAGLFAADKPGTFKRVESDRVHALDAEKMLPCLQVEFEGEEITARARDSNGMKVERTGSYSIWVSARGTGLQDRLDVLAAKVETRLGADRTLGGLVMAASITATEYSGTGDAEKRTGAFKISVLISVWTLEADSTQRA